MKKVLAWTIGGLILLGLTFVSILSVNDAYVTITALRGAGSPGTMTITSSERNWRVFFTTCFAEGVFIPDGGGQPLNVVLDGDCSPTGTAVRAQYTPSLRDLVGLPVSVEQGSWGDVALVLGVGSFFILLTIAGWVTTIEMLRHGDDEYGWRYERVRLATSVDLEELTEWLAEHFTTAWVEPLPSGGATANVALLDGELLSDLDDLPAVGASLAEIGGEACVMRWPDHTHSGANGVESRPWMECSLSPAATTGDRVVTVVACPEASDLLSVGTTAMAVSVDGFGLIDQDCANRNSAEREAGALMIAIRGGRVTLRVHEDGSLLARAGWNHQGRLLGEGSPARLRALCPTWPIETWPTELIGLAMPDRERLAEVLTVDGEPEQVVRAIAAAWQLPVRAVVDHLTGGSSIGDMPGATMIRPRGQGPTLRESD